MRQQRRLAWLEWLGGAAASDGGRSTRAQCRLEVLEDRTLPSVYMVQDINPGPATSNPNYLTEMNGVVYLSADHPTSGREIWRSDGTTTGTKLVTNHIPGVNQYGPYNLTNAGGTLYFGYRTGDYTATLGRTTGTGAGTINLASYMNVAGSPEPRGFTSVGNRVFFSGDQRPLGREPWTTTGMTGGTALLRDLRPGTDVSSGPSNFTNYFGWSIFTATGTSGTELWLSDGTAANTVMIRDLNPGTANGATGPLVNANGNLFFAGNDGSTGSELWLTYGSPDYTFQVKDINPGAASSSPREMLNVYGMLFFTAEANGRRGLYRSDGTPEGTVLLKELNLAPGGLARLTEWYGYVYFFEQVGQERQLWVTDWTPEGTRLVRTFLPESNRFLGPYTANVNGVFTFVADDGTTGKELWFSFGTEALTFPAADIVPGVLGSDPDRLTVRGNTLFFTADDQVNGRELWAYNPFAGPGSGPGGGLPGQPGPEDPAEGALAAALIGDAALHFTTAEPIQETPREDAVLPERRSQEDLVMLPAPEESDTTRNRATGRASTRADEELVREIADTW